MFNLIKEAAVRIDLIFNRKCFQINFEIGMIMAIKELLGHQVKIKDCLYHFEQIYMVQRKKSRTIWGI